MGSSFVTTTASEPVVVIIDDQSILAVWLEQFFLESGLAVCRTELSAIEATLRNLDQSGQTLYKIVFLYGFTPHGAWFRDLLLQPQVIEQHQELVSHALSLLKERKEQTVFIIRESSLDLSRFSSPVIVKLQKLLQLEKTIFEQVRQYTNAQVFVGVDTLDYASELELPLLYSVLGIPQNVVFNPENFWHLQTVSAFYAVVANQLIKPHQAQIVIVSGIKKNSAFWLQKLVYLYQQYFGVLPTIVSTPSDNSPLFRHQEAVFVQTSESWQEVLDVKIRNIPTLLKDIQEINQALLALDQSPIHISIKDLVNDDRSTHFKEPHKEFKTDKTGLSSRSPNIAQANISRPKNDSINNNETDKRSIYQSNNQYESESSEVVIEEWQERIAITQQKTLIEPLDENADITEEEPREKGVVYLDRELQNIFSHSRLKQRKNRNTQRVKTTKKLIFKSKRHRALFFSGLLLVGVGLCVGFTIAMYSLTVTQSRKIVFTTLQNYVQSKKIIPISNTWVDFLHNQVIQYKRVVKEDMLESGSVLADIAQTTNQLHGETKQSDIILANWLQGIQGVEEYDLEKNKTDFTKSLELQIESWNEFLGLTERVDVADLTTTQQETLNILKRETQVKLDDSNQIARFMVIIPELLGVKEKQTYAVIVQNDLEIRPTGGFIQNIILVTFHRGVLTDYQVYSTYEIDNRLVSVVMPPDEIKQVLGEQKWFLRDSNWNPDLPATAKQINWFLEESLNRSVDGVVTIHYGTIREILKSIGPLAIEQFNEEITDKNIYDKLEFHAEGKVADKAGKKVEYTSVLLTRLFEELKSLDKEKASGLFSVLYQGLAEKEIGLVLFKQQTGQVVKELGWDASVVMPKCPSQFLENTCVVDALYQVDANVGINKVNAYIEKNVTDEILINKKIITHQRSINYTNTAKLDLWPQGTYRSYLKFLLPADAALQSVSINSTPVTSDQLSIYTENGRKIVAFLLEVGKQKTAAVKISYQLNHSFDKPFSYFLFSQKQPGDRKTGTAVIKLEEGMRARVVAPQPKIQGQELHFVTPERDHLTLGVTIE